MTDINKLMAEALVKCGYADYLEKTYIGGNPNHPAIGCVKPENVGKTMEYRTTIEPFADTLEGRRQLDALFFYALAPDKQVIISGDGHFDTREQMINHVNEHFKQLAEKSHD